jgi:DNA-binding GntR family transcriptional regulator
MTTKQQEVQRILDTLAKAITQHRLRPGQRLIEAQIVEALDANRNHVQVALQRLAMQRIITIEPNRGATVAQPSAEEAREVFATRRCIERGIVEAITPERLAKHRKLIESHMKRERAAIQGSDRQAIVTMLSEYHTLLAKICGNSVLQDIFENLMIRSTLIVALYQRNDVPSCASDEHQQVLDALYAGDTARAVEVMMEHLSELEGQLILEEQEESEVNLADALKGL